MGAGHYSDSAYTDSEGSVTFAKPSERFLVIIDLTTLPYDTGVDKDLVFYDDTAQKYDTRFISAIANIEIHGDSSAVDFVYVDILNAHGEPIKANYSVNPNNSPVANVKASLLSRTIEASGSVTVGSIVEYYEFTVDVTSDPVELIAKALEEQKISKEDALDFYLELYESGYGGECGTPLITHIIGLAEDKALCNQLSAAKQGAIASITSIPNWDSQYPVSPASSDYFVIHYVDPMTGLGDQPPITIPVVMLVRPVLSPQAPEACNQANYVGLI